MRISIARPFKVTEVKTELGMFMQKGDYDVLAIGVVDPGSEESDEDFRQRTRLLVIDDTGHLVWVRPEECRVLTPQVVH